MVTLSSGRKNLAETDRYLLPNFRVKTYTNIRLRNIVGFSFAINDRLHGWFFFPAEGLIWEKSLGSFVYYYYHKDWFFVRDVGVLCKILISGFLKFRQGLRIRTKTPFTSESVLFLYIFTIRILEGVSKMTNKMLPTSDVSPSSHLLIESKKTTSSWFRTDSIFLLQYATKEVVGLWQ